MKVSIIFHSVNGNTYLMGKALHQAFSQKGVDVTLLRVEDHDLKKISEQFETAKQFYEEIVSLPIGSPEDILDSDLVILGSPTYFGNVSAEMKAFMDSCAGLWIEGKFVGKKLAAFTTAANAEGGGDLCLQTIHTFARHMGMVSFSVPSNLVPGTTIPAYGLIHYTTGPANKRPDQSSPVVNVYVDFLIKQMGCVFKS